jgi:hypothetical protein
MITPPAGRGSEYGLFCPDLEGFRAPEPASLMSQKWLGWGQWGVEEQWGVEDMI